MRPIIQNHENYDDFNLLVMGVGMMMMVEEDQTFSYILTYVSHQCTTACDDQIFLQTI